MRKDSLNKIELIKIANSLTLIARYNAPAFTERGSRLRNDKEKQKDIFEVAYLLNFFEELAIAVKHKTVNEVLIEDYFATVLRMWLEEEYIINPLKEVRRQDREIFFNIIELYRKWETKRNSKLRINEIPELQ